MGFLRKKIFFEEGRYRDSFTTLCFVRNDDRTACMDLAVAVADELMARMRCRRHSHSNGMHVIPNTFIYFFYLTNYFRYRIFCIFAKIF